MKVVILAGGRGNRINEISGSKNKCMIEVNGKPAIQHNFNNAVNSDIDEIIIVVGYRAEEIINYYGNSYKNKRLKYVIQWVQKGLVHALECAKDSIGGDDFMLMLGDEITVNPQHQNMLDKFKKEDIFALCGVLHVDDMNYIRRTYTVMQDGSDRIYRLIEKPRNPLNNIMGTGNCVFKNEILDYIDLTPIHHERKEKELPDLIQCAIDEGRIVKMFNLCSSYANINSMDDIKIAEKLIKEE